MIKPRLHVKMRLKKSKQIYLKLIKNLKLPKLSKLISSNRKRTISHSCRRKERTKLLKLKQKKRREWLNIS